METATTATQVRHSKKDAPRPHGKQTRRFEAPHIAEICARIDDASDRDDWVYVAAKIVEHRYVPALLVYRFIKECPAKFDDLRTQMIASYKKFVLEIEIHLGHRRAADAETIQRNWSVLVQAASYHSAVQFLLISTDILLCYKNAGLTEDGVPPTALVERMNRCYNGHEQVGFTQTDMAYAGYVADDTKPGNFIHPDTLHEIKIRVSRIPLGNTTERRHHKHSGKKRMTKAEFALLQSKKAPAPAKSAEPKKTKKQQKEEKEAAKNKRK